MSSPTDDELVDRLRTLAAVVDPAPAAVADSARTLFGLARLDAELARLVRDTAERPAALAVRAQDDDERLLSFQTGGTTVEMQISERAQRRNVVAHVIGVALAAAALETPTGRDRLQVDDGVLIAHDLHAGPIRLHLTTTGGGSIVTSWVLI